MASADTEGAIRSLLIDLARCQSKVILGARAWPKGE